MRKTLLKQADEVTQSRNKTYFSRNKVKENFKIPNVKRRILMMTMMMMMMMTTMIMTIITA